VWAKFVALVESEYAKGDFPALWSPAQPAAACALQAPTE
jgi:hypothetical protein